MHLNKYCTHVLQTSANNKDIEKYKSLFPEKRTTIKGPKKIQGSKETLDASSAKHTLL